MPKQPTRKNNFKSPKLNRSDSKKKAVNKKPKKPGLPRSNKINSSTSKPRKKKSNSQFRLPRTVQKVSQAIQEGKNLIKAAESTVDATKQLINSTKDLSSTLASPLSILDKKILGNILNSQLERAKEIDSQFSSTKEPDIYRLNYIPTNHFYVEMDGKVKASFKEFSGIGVNLKKESYLEGGVNDQQRVMLGHAEFSDVTLKRGMTDDSIFLSWVMQTLVGKPKNRRNINILLFNQAGETMQCYTLIGSIPISWKSPGFQADGNSVAIEELTLSYEGLNIFTKTPGGGPTLNIKRDSMGFFPDK